MGLQEWLLSLGIMSPGTCEKMGVLEKNWGYPHKTHPCYGFSMK
jgi:hypothetical protein